MVIDQPASLAAYERRRFEATGLSCEVFISASGREPVILLHELPSITPQVAYLGQVLNDAGFRVYMPSLLGRPGAVPNAFDEAASLSMACVRGSILALQKGDHTRGVVAGLRALAQQAQTETGCSVGIVGLCLTGGFALATAVDAGVAAAVACEPSLPFNAPGDIDLSPDDQATLADRVRQGGLLAMLLRFQGDELSPCARLRRYGDILSESLVSRCVPDSAADPDYGGQTRHHSVVTNHLVEGPGSLTQAVRDEMVAFLGWRLRGGPAPAPTAGVPDCLTLGCRRALPAGPVARDPTP